MTSSNPEVTMICNVRGSIEVVSTGTITTAELYRVLAEVLFSESRTYDEMLIANCWAILTFLCEHKLESKKINAFWAKDNIDRYVHTVRGALGHWTTTRVMKSNPDSHSSKTIIRRTRINLNNCIYEINIDLTLNVLSDVETKEIAIEKEGHTYNKLGDHQWIHQVESDFKGYYGDE